MLTTVGSVRFPTPAMRNVNMMPFIMGDPATLPLDLHPYLPIIDACGLARGRHAYLSVSESVVQAGQTQRRPGIHTEGTAAIGWGGGSWGGCGGTRWGGCAQGLGDYMASTDGACRAWDCEVMTTSAHGEVDEPALPPVYMEPSVLYWLSDRTPHEALPSPRAGIRQWVRLVGDLLGGWWVEHSTANPLGIAPNAPLLHGSKFA